VKNCQSRFKKFEKKPWGGAQENSQNFGTFFDTRRFPQEAVFSIFSVFGGHFYWVLGPKMVKKWSKNGQKLTVFVTKVDWSTFPFLYIKGRGDIFRRGYAV
jgi:hypothetical protein